MKVALAAFAGVLALLVGFPASGGVVLAQQAVATPAPPDAVTASATVMVYIDGRVASASTAEDNLCKALLMATPCTRFHCVNLDLSKLQYTVATIDIDPGSPSAPYLASQAALTSFVTRPYGVFRVDVVTAPPADSPGLISSADRTIYLAAGCAVAGALVALVGVCCCIKCRSKKPSATSSYAAASPRMDGTATSVALRDAAAPSPLAAVGRRRGMSTINGNGAGGGDVAGSEALWKKLRELDQRTEALAASRATTEALLEDMSREMAAVTSTAGGQKSNDMIQVDGATVKAMRERDADRNADGSPARGAAAAEEPWWRRDGVTEVTYRTQEDHVPLFLATAERPGDAEANAAYRTAMLHRSLVNASLAERVPAQLSRHWYLRPNFPKLPASVAAVVHVAQSVLCGLGVFAIKFIPPGTILFPYISPEYFAADAVASIKYSEMDLGLQFGWDWHKRLNFVLHDPARDIFIVAEEPLARGWGCLLNSAHGESHLDANCEVVWNGYIPYIRTTKCVPPLAELLLDYRFVRPAPPPPPPPPPPPS